jgi:hypothetical protein
VISSIASEGGWAKVVHRVDAPGVAGPVVVLAADAVQHRVPHGDVRRGHVDLRAEHVCPVLELARAHAQEQIEVLLDGTIPVRALPARLGQRPPVLAHLVGRQAVDVGEAALYQVDGIAVQRFEVVRCVPRLALPREPQPPHVVLNRLDVLHILFGRVGVVESQVARAPELGGDPEVQADRLGMADVEVAVRLRWKARGDPAPVGARLHIGSNDGANEVQGSVVGLPNRSRGCPVNLHKSRTFIIGGPFLPRFVPRAGRTPAGRVSPTRYPAGMQNRRGAYVTEP